MTKQAKNLEDRKAINPMQLELQTRFTKLSPEQRMIIANYLNAYNLAAWIYNELLDEDMKTYVDLSMKFVIETQNLDKAMEGVGDSPSNIQQLVDRINDGE